MYSNVSILSKKGMMDNLVQHLLLIVFFVMLVFIFSSENYATPSFARQTHLSCNYCHYTFPSLTSFGRMFKLNGYTLTNIETIDAVSPDSSRNTLKLLSTYAFSSSVKSSYTSINKATPDQDNNFVLSPQVIGLALSGEITPNIGAYVQFEYHVSDGVIGLDMLDVRYADHTKVGSKDLLYGLTLNNIPSMQDVWNTTPVWSFPYLGPKKTPTPMASTYVSSTEGVAGLGAYALFDKLIYAEFSLYHSSPVDASYPPDATWTSNIKGSSPYWRAAVQHQWQDQYLEVGTFGMTSEIYPAGISGLTDRFTDIGFDAQYEKNIETGGSLIFHAAFTTEKQNLDASFNAGDAANVENGLNVFNTDLTYNFPEYVSLSVGYFSTTGSSDILLYAPGQVKGSHNNIPNSNGEIIQLTFLPWMNTQFAIQYNMYSKFNGGDTNYDGFGRNASDNNTLYVVAWLFF